jgi:hypothetical protein
MLAGTSKNPYRLYMESTHELRSLRPRAVVEAQPNGDGMLYITVLPTVKNLLRLQKRTWPLVTEPIQLVATFILTTRE